MLNYLSGIGANRVEKKQAKKTAKAAAKLERTQIKQQTKAVKQAGRQERAASSIKFASQPVKKAAQKIAVQRKKAKVEKVRRTAMKQAAEPVNVKPEQLEAAADFVENEATSEMDQDINNIDSPEFSDSDSFDSENDGGDLGIIYPGIGAVKKKKKKTTKKGASKQKVKKITIAPARGAFLLLVNLNIFKLATKLAQFEKKKPGALKKYWVSIGGDFNKLLKAVNKKAAMGEPITAASISAAIASATPILVKISKLLKSAGIELPIKDDTTGATLPVSEPVKEKTGMNTGTKVLIGAAAAALAYKLIKK